MTVLLISWHFHSLFNLVQPVYSVISCTFPHDTPGHFCNIIIDMLKLCVHQSAVLNWPLWWTSDRFNILYIWLNIHRTNLKNVTCFINKTFCHFLNYTFCENTTQQIWRIKFIVNTFFYLLWFKCCCFFVLSFICLFTEIPGSQNKLKVLKL